jgi:hypothetical protein
LKTSNKENSVNNMAFSLSLKLYRGEISTSVSITGQVVAGQLCVTYRSHSVPAALPINTRSVEILAGKGEKSGTLLPSTGTGTDPVGIIVLRAIRRFLMVRRTYFLAGTAEGTHSYHGRLYRT